MQNCEQCTFKKWIKTNPQKYKWVEGHRVRVWLCAKCGRQQAELPPFMQTEPKILYVDIESSLTNTFSWGLKVPSKYINPAMLLKPPFVITWAASWMGSNKVESGAVTPSQARAWNDKQMLKPLWKLIDQADIVAGHNSDKFDLRKLKARWMLHGFHKPRTFRTLDTIKIARKEFDLPSYSLASICQMLGFNPKADMGLEDWIRICIDGDEKTIEKMRRYNMGDVREGKKVLERFKPWIHPFPAEPRGGYK